MGKTV